MPVQAIETFIDSQCIHSGVEPICKVLPLAPSTNDRHAARQTDPLLQSARRHSDTQRMTPIQAVWQDNFQADGWRDIGSACRDQPSAVLVAGGVRLMRRRPPGLRRGMIASLRCVSLVGSGCRCASAKSFFCAFLSGLPAPAGDFGAGMEHMWQPRWVATRSAQARVA